jgi:hypothetical protein
MSSLMGQCCSDPAFGNLATFCIKLLGNYDFKYSLYGEFGQT